MEAIRNWKNIIWTRKRQEVFCVWVLWRLQGAWSGMSHMPALEAKWQHWSHHQWAGIAWSSSKWGRGWWIKSVSTVSLDTLSDKHMEQGECIGSYRDSSWKLNGSRATNIYWNEQKTVLFIPFFFPSSSQYVIFYSLCKMAIFVSLKSIVEKEHHHALPQQHLAPEPLIHQYPSDANKNSYEGKI